MATMDRDYYGETESERLHYGHHQQLTGGGAAVHHPLPPLAVAGVDPAALERAAASTPYHNHNNHGRAAGQPSTMRTAHPPTTAVAPLPAAPPSVSSWSQQPQPPRPSVSSGGSRQRRTSSGSQQRHISSPPQLQRKFPQQQHQPQQQQQPQPVPNSHMERGRNPPPQPSRLSQSRQYMRHHGDSLEADEKEEERLRPPPPQTRRILTSTQPSSSRRWQRSVSDLSADEEEEGSDALQPLPPHLSQQQYVQQRYDDVYEQQRTPPRGGSSSPRRSWQQQQTAALPPPAPQWEEPRQQPQPQSLASSTNSNRLGHHRATQTGRCTPLENDILVSTTSQKDLNAPAVNPATGSPSRRDPRRATHADEAAQRQRKGAVLSHLVREGFTSGLASAMLQNTELFALRTWLVDNSGSMLKTDGHRVVQSADGSGRVKSVDCTRWEEVTSTVTWHAQLAALLRAPTVFRLLNDPGQTFGSQQFSVAEGSPHQLHSEVKIACDTMRKATPNGPSHLTVHLREMYDSVKSVSRTLVSEGKLIGLVIATDGLPTDEEGYEGEDINEEFLDALRLFHGLPVWVVVRLSTDDPAITQFYNDCDETLTAGGTEVNMTVLDDYVGEAEGIYQHNPWLNYALPLHLARESCLNFDEFDVIDKRTLQRSELREFCSVMFGGGGAGDGSGGNVDDDGGSSLMEGVPDPVADWRGFRKGLEAAVKKQRKVWNPIKRKVMPWIDFRELDRIYGGHASADTSCSCVII